MKGCDGCSCWLGAWWGSTTAIADASVAFAVSLVLMLDTWLTLVGEARGVATSGSVVLWMLVSRCGRKRRKGATEGIARRVSALKDAAGSKLMRGWCKWEGKALR